MYKKQAFLSHNQKVDVYWKAETKSINQLCGDPINANIKEFDKQVKSLTARK